MIQTSHNKRIQAATNNATKVVTGFLQHPQNTSCACLSVHGGLLVQSWRWCRVAFPHLFSMAYSFPHFESAILRVCFSLIPFLFRPPSPEIRRMRHTHEQRGTFWRLWRSVMVVGSHPPLSFEIILHSYLTVLALGTGAVSKFLLTIYSSPIWGKRHEYSCSADQFGRNSMTGHALQISLGETAWLVMLCRSVWEKQHDWSCSADQFGRNSMTGHALQISLGETAWLVMLCRSVWEKQHDWSCSADQILPSYTSMRRSACILWRPLSVSQVIELLNFKGDAEQRSVTGPVDRNGKELKMHA